MWEGAILMIWISNLKDSVLFLQLMKDSGGAVGTFKGQMQNTDPTLSSEKDWKQTAALLRTQPRCSCSVCLIFSFHCGGSSIICQSSLFCGTEWGLNCFKTLEELQCTTFGLSLPHNRKVFCFRVGESYAHTQTHTNTQRQDPSPSLVALCECVQRWAGPHLLWALPETGDAGVLVKG